MRLCACKYMHHRVPDSYGFRVHLVYVLHLTRENLEITCNALLESHGHGCHRRLHAIMVTFA